MNGWTEADQAELDVLVHALAADFEVHRQLCRACPAEPCPRYEAWLAHKADCLVCDGSNHPWWKRHAPLTYGWRCEWRERFLVEHRDCVRCLPCPHLQAAIAVVVEWREARALLSRAEWLRHHFNERGVT